MPILEVELVLRPDEVIAAGLAALIADRAAAVFGAAPGRTWVRLRTLPPSHYAEDSGGPPPGVSPVFVTVLHARLPGAAALAEEARQLAETIAAACDRPTDNVHVFYQPDGAGRVAFGGKLVP